MRISDWSSDVFSSDLRRCFLKIKQIREQILGAAIAERLDTAADIRMIVAHHQHWWCIRTIDQQAGFLVDRQVERAQRAPAAALLEPRFGGSEQRSKYVGLVFGGDQAAIADRKRTRLHSRH